MATYDVKSGELLSPMDAYILALEAGNAEFDLEQIGLEEEQEVKKGTTKEVARPNPNFFQQQLQIHANNMVSTFLEDRCDDNMVGSGTLSKQATQSPSEVTTSTL